MSTTAQGTFSMPAAIPASASITGAVLNSQVGVVDPAAAGIGVAFSNGIELELQLDGTRSRSDST